MTRDITIRFAFPDDASSVMRLAALDSAPRIPSGPLLVAEVDGDLWAAVAVHSRVAMADPFRPTAHVVALLMERARQLTAEPPRRRLDARRRMRHREVCPITDVRRG